MPRRRKAAGLSASADATYHEGLTIPRWVDGKGRSLKQWWFPTDLPSVMEAVGGRLDIQPDTSFQPMTLADLARSARRHAGDGETVLRLCLQFVDDFREADPAIRPGLLRDVPPSTGDARWDAFLAAIGEHLEQVWGYRRRSAGSPALLLRPLLAGGLLHGLHQQELYLRVHAPQLVAGPRLEARVQLRADPQQEALALGQGAPTGTGSRR
jgi:hypothetical protein